ncbi:MAG: tetratricopeptide repeat protein [Elusimicrobiota bacterium]
MKRTVIIASLAAFLAGQAQARLDDPWESKDPGDQELQIETWNSFAMEAKAISGELRFQDNDLPGAKDSFKDSLNSSLNVKNPHQLTMGLDLYRTAQLAVAEKDMAAARRHLEILIHRYPDTEWADRGRRLMALISSSPVEEEDEEVEEQPLGDVPELKLRRIQSALREDRSRDALRESVRFLRRYPDHPAAQEVRLAVGLLELESGDAAAASRELEGVARAAVSAELRGKAAYLLAASYFSLGDFESLRSAAALGAGTANKWQLLTQAWLAAADELEGRRATALSRYHEISRAQVDSPLAAYALAAEAAAEERSGRLSKAAADMREAASLAEHWGLGGLAVAARLSTGHILYKARRLGEAAAVYSDFASRHPGHPQLATALFQKGLTLRRLGHREEAAYAFEEMLGRFPASPFASPAHVQLGQLYAELGRSSEAVEHYGRMAKSAGAGPSADKESVLLVAQVHYNNKRYRQAIPSYRKFLESYSDDPRAYEVEELLLTSYWMGDKQSPELLKALSLYPRHAIVAHIRWELAKSALEKEDCVSGEYHLRRLLSDFPSSPNAAQALLLRGECLAKKGDKTAATAVFKELSERFPNSPQARSASFKLGTALFEAGDFAGSEAAYRRSGDGDDSLAADALFNRGLSMLKAGNKKGALAVYGKLMSRFPDYPRGSWVWLQIGVIREEAGRYRDAVAAYSRVTGSQKPQSLLRTGRCYERLKKLASARKVYESLRKMEPAADTSRLHGLLRLGLLYEMQGRFIEAMPLYACVVRLGQGTPLAQTALMRMRSLTKRGYQALR